MTIVALHRAATGLIVKIIDDMMIGMDISDMTIGATDMAAMNAAIDMMSLIIVENKNATARKNDVNASAANGAIQAGLMMAAIAVDNC